MSNVVFPLPPLVMIPPRPVSESCGALGAQPCLAPVPDIPRLVIPLVAAQPKEPIPSPAPLPEPRCSVKGCVFPAPFEAPAICRYHQLQQSEAQLFQSHQPTYLLSLQAPFGLPDHEPDDSRQQDRKRQAAEREAFILDEADSLGI